MGVPELELPPGLTLGVGRTTRTTRHWLDTFDRRLLGKGREMWVEPAAEGAEARVVVDGWTASWPLDVAPRVVRPAELPPAVDDRLGDVLADRALVPLASAVVTESEHGVRDEEQKTVCRVLLQRAGAVRRVQVRPLRGYEKEAARVAAALGDSASPPDDRPGLVLAVLDAAGATEAPGSRPAGAGLDPKAPAGVGVAQILGRLLDTVAANLEGTLGRYDDEFLHDLRVAVRRGRTALKIARGFVDPAPAQLLAGELKWLGDMTTPARDLDVHLQDAPRMAAGVDEELRGHLQPFVDLLRAKQDRAYCDLTAALTSERFERLTADLPRLLSELQPPIEWENAVVTTDELARAALEKTFSRVVKRGRRLAPESPDEAVHDLRKRAKELRYSLEFFGALLPADEASGLVRDLKGMQDVLGRYNDSVVQREFLRECADELMAQGVPAATLLALGEMSAEIARSGRKARADLATRFEGLDRWEQSGRFAEMVRGAG